MKDSGGFEVLGPIVEIETIAVGPSIRELERLERKYGPGRWRKMKGITHIRLENDTIRLEEVHWYECHGIGKKEFKIKRRQQ